MTKKTLDEPGVLIVTGDDLAREAIKNPGVTFYFFPFPAILFSKEVFRHVNEERIKMARKADLYKYLVANHPSAIRIEGNYLCLKEYDSIYVKKGSSCFFASAIMIQEMPLTFW